MLYSLCSCSKINGKINAVFDYWKPQPAEVAARMRRVNPVVIPRNHRVEEALSAAESGDLGPLHRLLAALRDPFVETKDNEPYRGGPPAGCGAYRTFCGT